MSAFAPPRTGRVDSLGTGQISLDCSTIPLHRDHVELVALHPARRHPFTRAGKHRSCARLHLGERVAIDHEKMRQSARASLKADQLHVVSAKGKNPAPEWIERSES